MEEEERSLKDYVIFGIRIGVTIALILLGKLWLNEDNFPWYVNLIVMGAAYLVIAYDIIFKMNELGGNARNYFDLEQSLIHMADIPVQIPVKVKESLILALADWLFDTFVV